MFKPVAEVHFGDQHKYKQTAQHKHSIYAIYLQHSACVGVIREERVFVENLFSHGVHHGHVLLTDSDSIDIF